MTRLLAIVCVFLIVIGLYSAWRNPRSDSPDSRPAADAAVAAPEATDDAPADAGDPVQRPRERSLDR